MKNLRCYKKGELFLITLILHLVKFNRTFALMNDIISFSGIVFKHTGSRYLVKHPQSATLIDCIIRGKLRLKDVATTNPITVGDNVDVEMTNEKEGIITAVHPRRNYIIRRATNLSRQAHILAANIDCAYLIVTMDFPSIHLEFVDRFLVTCEAYKVTAKIIINKTDLYDDVLLEKLEEFKAIYSLAGYEIIEVSAQTAFQITLLRDDIKDKLCLFSGISGVGKSSLINAIDPTLSLRTGAISAYHQKGTHTTTFYEMFIIKSGGYIIDTPGIKGFGLVDVEKEELYHFFPEIFKHAAHCKFNPCMHLQEPQCAVKEAVEHNTISQARYESYLKMLNDEGEKYR